MKHITWKIKIKDSYVHLLVILILMFLLSPFIPHNKDYSTFPLLPLIFLAGIIFTLRTLHLRRKIFIMVTAIAIAWYVCQLLIEFFTSGDAKENLKLASLAIFCLFLIISIVLMIHKMFSASEVTSDTIIGGICVYILLGFLWAIFYSIIHTIDSNAFFPTEITDHGSFFYFSFMTLTTVGYGDMFPINRFAKSLASLEAVFGQLYIAIFISRLVGLHLAKKIYSKN